MSEVQNINDKPYRDYVRLYCDDNKLQELTSALDIIWEHPEGQKKIIESYNRKGTLDIVYDNEQIMAGYGMPKCLVSAAQFVEENGCSPSLEHRITIPLDLGQPFQDDLRKCFKPSLIGVLAHELYHAADPNINTPENISFQQNLAYSSMQISISNVESNLEIINRFLPENYNSLSEDEKTKLLSDIYDHTNCADLLAESNERHLNNSRIHFSDNTKTSNYVKKVETPAIDFANIIVKHANAKREYQEPQRINDYSDSVPLIENYKMDKETFVMITSITMNEIIGHQGKDNYLQEIREQYAPALEQLKSGALVRIEDCPLKNGALVRIEDTPQAQVKNIASIGRVVSQNKAMQI